MIFQVEIERKVLRSEVKITILFGLGSRLSIPYSSDLRLRTRYLSYCYPNDRDLPPTLIVPICSICWQFSISYRKVSLMCRHILLTATCNSLNIATLLLVDFSLVCLKFLAQMIPVITGFHVTSITKNISYTKYIKQNTNARALLANWWHRPKWLPRSIFSLLPN